jgi:hypothetical protein
MKQVFDPCVNRTLELIDGQVAAVMKAGLGKPKVILLYLRLSLPSTLTS